MKTLYQFPFSHFCEKVRWALDYKEQNYIIKNLIPGPHMKVTKKMSRRSSVPILVDGDKTIQDSTTIIDYLDQQYPNKLLTPINPALAQEAKEWEEYFDDEIGVTLRAWFYYYALPDKRVAYTFLLHKAPWYGKPLYALIFPMVRKAMFKMMDINSETVKKYEKRLIAALSQLNNEVQNRKFLVGGEFTRADLTACALLGHFCCPIEEFKKVFPEPVLALSQQYVEQPVYKWVNKIYKEYRAK